MECGPRGQLSFEERLEELIYLLRAPRRTKHRDSVGVRSRQEVVRHLQSLGDKDGGHVECEQHVETVRRFHGIERREVRHLGLPEHPHPTIDYTGRVPRQGQPRRSHIGVSGFPIETDVIEGLQGERLPLRLQNLADGDARGVQSITPLAGPEISASVRATSRLATLQSRFVILTPNGDPLEG